MSPEKIIEIGEFYVATKNTVRGTAKVFGVSKSSVHKVLTFWLPDISPVLAKKVQKVINVNKKERGRRGGIAVQKVLAKKRMFVK